MVTGAATHVHERQPLESDDHVGMSLLRKHWQGCAGGQLGAAEVARTVEAARVVGATVEATAPQEQELGQPRASVAQVMTAPEGQSHEGMEPQRAVVGATVVARAVVGAAVVARAVVAATPAVLRRTVEAGAAVVARAVVGATVESSAWQKHV